MTDSGLKEKLLDALQDSVANYNDGMDENLAVAKAADDHGFNKAQTERLCETFNTCRTLNHFDNNKSEKAASFPLVSKDEVLGILFDSDNEKMAASVLEPVEASSGYSEPETDFYVCKSAEDFNFDPVFAGTERDIPDLDANTQRMSVKLAELSGEADRLNAEAGVEMELARKATAKLASMLVASYSVGDIQKVAAVIGIMADKPERFGVFEAVSSHLPEYVMGCDVKLAHVVDDRLVPVEAALIDEIGRRQENASKMLAEADKKAHEYKQASDSFAGIIDGHLKSNVTENAMDRFVRNGISKSAGILGTGLATIAVSQVPRAINKLRERPTEIDREVDDANKRFINMHRETILTDLVNNDPYLSQEDPQTIARYYSNFAELSPSLANNKEVVRSVLRQAVHNGGGGYSPFDAGSFVDVEKTLGEIRGTLPARKSIQIGGGSESDDEDE